MSLASQRRLQSPITSTQKPPLERKPLTPRGSILGWNCRWSPGKRGIADGGGQTSQSPAEYSLTVFTWLSCLCCSSPCVVRTPERVRNAVTQSYEKDAKCVINACDPKELADASVAKIYKTLADIPFLRKGSFRFTTINKTTKIKILY